MNIADRRHAMIRTRNKPPSPSAPYQPVVEKAAAGGYASLDGSATVPDAQIPSTIARDTDITAEAADRIAGDAASVATAAADATTKANAAQSAAIASAASSLATHVAAADPHTGYQKESEKNAANGYAGLDGSSHLPANSVDTTAIVADAVTYAKIQNVSATDKLLGRSSASAGDIEEITCTAAGRALLDDADAAAQRTTLAAEGTVNKDANNGYGGLSFGTFTPVVKGSGTAGTYELAASTDCSWTKNGDIITVFVRIVFAGALTGGGTLNLRIANLPTNMSAARYTGFTTAIVNGIAFTGSYVGVERISSGATAELFLYGVDNAGTQTQIPISAVGVGDQIMFTLTYKV